jgi:hypothetical protein
MRIPPACTGPLGAAVQTGPGQEFGGCDSPITRRRALRPRTRPTIWPARGEALRLWQFGNGVREPKTIRKIVIEAFGRISSAVFWIANLRIHTSSGLKEIVPLMAERDCRPPQAIPEAIRLPPQPRCYMGGSLPFFLEPEGQEVLAEVRKLVPNLGMAASFAHEWNPAWRDAIERARRQGLDIRLQNAGVAGMEAHVTRSKAWGVDPVGRSRNTTPGMSFGTVLPAHAVPTTFSHSCLGIVLPNAARRWPSKPHLHRPPTPPDVGRHRPASTFSLPRRSRDCSSAKLCADGLDEALLLDEDGCACYNRVHVAGGEL